ncbi:MAG: ComEC/Rec2 family competence protein [Vicingaceae bacterium]
MPQNQSLIFTLPPIYFSICLLNLLIVELSSNSKRSFILLSLAFVLFGTDLQNRSRNLSQDDILSFTSEEAAVIFRVENVKQGSKSNRIMVSLLGFVDGENPLELPHRILIFYPKRDSLFVAGSTYSASLSLSRIKSNPTDEFNWEKYWARRCIYFQSFLASNKSLLLLKSREPPFLNIEDHQARLDKGLDKDEFTLESKALLKALVLGNKSALGTEMKEAFARSGIMHLLAVSGLHVGIVFLFIKGILDIMQYIFRYSFNVLGISVIAVWIYAGITGFSASVVRASLMLSFYLLSLKLKRRSHGLSLLCLSAFLALSLDPDLLWDLGFQLSYVAVCGILLAYPILRSIFNPSSKILKYLWSLISLSLAAQICTFPIASHNFGMFPTYFLLGNIVAMPIAALLLGTGLFLSFFNSEMIGIHEIAIALDSLIGHFLSVINGISALPFSAIEVELNAGEVICMYAVLIALLNLIYHPEKNSLRLVQIVVVMSLFILEFY